MQTTSSAYRELLDFLSSTPAPGEVLRFLPGQVTVERLDYLLQGYKNGELSAREIGELDAVMELVPFMRAYQRQAARHRE
jgi:hypothetical protein